MVELKYVPISLQFFHVYPSFRMANYSGPGDLRPISLSNMMAKVIIIVIKNSMKGFLQGVVSENQSAFIVGRLISDNILINYEVMHH